MPHAILGAGGVGGFVGAVLAGAGEQVTLLLRPETYAVHPDTLSLESPLGNITAPCRRAAALEEDVDVLWVATKATQLEAALGAVPVPRRARMVVPLLNGVDHVARLRSRFDARRVVPGTIAAELERTSPGQIVLRSPFARFGFAAAGRDVLAPVAAILTRFGCATAFESDELTLLWRKLVLLAPMALTTTASGMAVGELRAHPEWGPRFEAAAREASAVGHACGAAVNAEETLRTLRGFPDTLRSSMQKDVAAGRPPELDAIGGPIVRGGRAHGIAVAMTAALVAAIQARIAPAGSTTTTAPRR
jgi:2-dehydropantoate 2-reductase